MYVINSEYIHNSRILSKTCNYVTLVNECLKALYFPWHSITRLTVVIDSLMVSVLATGPNVRGFKAGRGRRIDGYLRAI
jgi:hypothetical protein